MNLLNNIHQRLVRAAVQRFGHSLMAIRHALLLTYMGSLVIFYSFSFGAYYLFVGMDIAFFICMYGAASAGTLLWWMFGKRTTAYTAHYYCFSTVCFFLLFSCCYGGIESPYVPWLVTAPLVGSLLLKKWETWLWAGIALGLLPILFWITPFLPDTASWGYKANESIITLVSHGGFLSFFLGVIMSLEQVRSDLKRLERVKDAEQAESLSAVQAILKAKDDERQRVARDLHDHIGTLLTVVRLRHESLLSTEVVQKEGSVFFDHLDWLGHNLSTLSQWFSLHFLHDFGILKGLEHLAAEYEREVEKQVELILPPQSSPSLEHHGPHLYRIVQEILAFPSSIKIASPISMQLLQMKDQIRFMVEISEQDVVQTLVQSDSWAHRLTSIRDRTRVIGGDFLQEVSHGSVLTLIIEMPLVHAAD